MRKRLSLVLVLALSAVMAYGVIGSAALFSSSAPVVGHDLTTGTLVLSTNAPQTVYCEVVMNTSTGTKACAPISVTYGGGVAPTQISVTFAVDGGNIETNKISLTGAFGQQAYSGTIDVLNGLTIVEPNPETFSRTGLPFTATYSWSDLSVQGAHATVSLTFTAQG